MRPLKRSITLVCAVFFVLLSTVLSVATYRIYTGAMYGRYQKQMKSVADFLGAQIDHDDMSQCAETYVESEKYREFQAFLDDFVDRYHDVRLVHLVQVLPSDVSPRVREICEAHSAFEKTYEADQLLNLGDADQEWLERDMEDELYQIQRSQEDVYLLNSAYGGSEYTLARPLVNSEGKHYGVLCIDIAAKDLNRTVYRNMNLSIALTVGLGMAFLTLLLFWLRSNVTDPLNQLERSVTDFANSSAGRCRPEELQYNPPEIHSRNEVQSMSEAMTKLSIDMKEYVQSLVAARNQTRGLQARAQTMNNIAYKDALTHVRNKAAYDKKVEDLNWGILNQKIHFGIVMVDLNYLKVINDRYGHEHGNEYIMGACSLICNIFDHSPVFRVGGDEFVVILQGRDYENRERLVEELRTGFARSTMQEDADPWQRYSAAVGLAVSQPGDNAQAVFNRADEAMYRAKAEMKAQRI